MVRGDVAKHFELAGAVRCSFTVHIGKCRTHICGKIPTNKSISMGEQAWWYNATT